MSRRCLGCETPIRGTLRAYCTKNCRIRHENNANITDLMISKSYQDAHHDETETRAMLARRPEHLALKSNNHRAELRGALLGEDATFFRETVDSLTSEEINLEASTHCDICLKDFSEHEALDFDEFEPCCNASFCGKCAGRAPKKNCCANCDAPLMAGPQRAAAIAKSVAQKNVNALFHQGKKEALANKKSTGKLLEAAIRGHERAALLIAETEGGVNWIHRSAKSGQKMGLRRFAEGRRAGLEGFQASDEDYVRLLLRLAAMGDSENTWQLARFCKENELCEQQTWCNLIALAYTGRCPGAKKELEALMNKREIAIRKGTAETTRPLRCLYLDPRDEVSKLLMEPNGFTYAGTPLERCFGGDYDSDEDAYYHAARKMRAVGATEKGEQYLLTAATTLGNPAAMREFGQRHAARDDLDKAVQWYLNAGDAESHLGLAWAVYPTRPDVALVDRLTKKPDKNAQKVFDSSSAADWWRRAAAQGSLEAQFQYAVSLEDEESYSKAIKLYDDAAKQGHTQAMWRLDILYRYLETGAGKRAQARDESRNTDPEEEHQKQLRDVYKQWTGKEAPPEDLTIDEVTRVVNAKAREKEAARKAEEVAVFGPERALDLDKIRAALEAKRAAKKNAKKYDSSSDDDSVGSL